MNPIVSCQSTITDVVVYGRGAIVTRTIHVPDGLADGIVDIHLDGLPALADAGGIRAEIAAKDRRIVALQSSLTIPEQAPIPGTSVQRVEELAARIERWQDERSVVQAERERLEGIEPKPPRRRALYEAPRQHLDDSLAAGGLLDDILARLDARLLDLEASLVQARKDLEAARLADSQAESSQREGVGHPTRRVHLRLDGNGPVEAIRLMYAVAPARWWPVYTLRLTEKGSATFWMEALVAQLSGENWKNARLSLCTAGLIDDIRLPVLASMRLGRAQPVEHRGYRLAPPDLDRLFLSFDVFISATADGGAQVPSVALGSGIGFGMPAMGMPLPAPPPSPQPSPAPVALMEESKYIQGIPRSPAADGRERAPQMPKPAFRAMAAKAPPRPAAVAAASPGAGAYLPNQAELDGGGVDGAPSVPMEAALDVEQQSLEPPQPVEPADAWLDFDSLRLGSGFDREHRGRLYRQSDSALASRQQRALSRIEALSPSALVQDPYENRGAFDHRFDAQGGVEVPSDGRAHRITLSSASAPARFHYRTVPVESAEVYRELVLTNPLQAPILDGPVDVYLDGSLLTTTRVERIDEGGSFRVGLGVEERIRVARNVRVEEETTGLLGGTTSIQHSVQIDLRSSMGSAVSVEVLDRIPDTDDKNIEIKVGKFSQPGIKYTQMDRGTPIRGGYSWSVELSAGGSETLTYSYRILLPSKNEIVGGNRRD